MLRIHFDIQFHVHVHRDETHHTPIPKEKRTFETSFTQYAEQQIEKTRQQGRYSTSRNYRTALHSFQHFLQKRHIPFHDITTTLMSDYERWLKSRRIEMGTLSCYLRSLRALYNKAVEEHCTTDNHPFTQTFTGYPSSDKRSISIDEIRQVREVPLKEGSVMALVRDLFLFCIYACGMPFIDIAFLRKSQISEDGYLTYHRRKTNEKIRIRLLPYAQEIIRRYQSSDTDYVFPILTHTDPDKAYRQYKDKLCYYNKVLKRLGQKAGIRHKLTSYVSRHSWATLAYSQDTELSVISKGLGHTSPRTTMTYIKAIDDDRLDDANRKIAEEIMGKKKCTPYKR